MSPGYQERVAQALLPAAPRLIGALFGHGRSTGRDARNGSAPRKSRTGRHECLRHGLAVLITLFGLALAVQAQTFPPQDESLRYSVNWPSGLSLGEANLTAHRAGSGWDLDLTLDANVPGFAIADHFHSTTNGNSCSQTFERDTRHGSKKSQEKTTFDYPAGLLHRTTLNGGASDYPISPHCAWDALNFLYFARYALAHGSMPPRETIYFGSPYSLHMEYTGEQTIQVSDKPIVADRISVSVKGRASDSTFEMFFARDAARTPLLVKIPVAVGTISLELAR